MKEKSVYANNSGEPIKAPSPTPKTVTATVKTGTDLRVRKGK